MKKIIVALLSLVLCLGGVALANDCAQIPSVMVFTTGSAEDFSTVDPVAVAQNTSTATKRYLVFHLADRQIRMDPLERNGKTYVSIRQAVEQFDGKVFWYGGREREICFITGKTKVYLNFRDGVFLANGKDLRVADNDFYWFNGRCYMDMYKLAKLLQQAV